MFVELPPHGPEAIAGRRALASQDSFFRSRSRKLFAVGGNRAGVSTAGAMLVSSLATRRSIVLSGGGSAVIPQIVTDRPANIWVVGFDGRSIGGTIFRLLFARPKTGVVPVIPYRYVDDASWRWEDKPGRWFTSVNTRDRDSQEQLATICAFSSKALPKRYGGEVDLIWIDVGLHDPRQILDLAERLGPGGRLIYTGWPCEDTIEMIEAIGVEPQDVHHMSTFDNHQVDANSLSEILPRSEWATRLHGQFA